jgi:hypothetical protein
MHALALRRTPLDFTPSRATLARMSLIADSRLSIEEEVSG